MGFGQVTYNGPAFATRAAYYTALALDGTTAITDALLDGYVLCVDLTTTTITAPSAAPALAHFAAGGATIDLLGVTVTQPEDGANGDNLPYFAGIAMDVPPDFDSAGWLWMIPGGAAVDCLVGVDTALDPATYLGPVTGEWHLGAITTSVANAAANALALSKIVALPLVADTTLTATPAQIKCRVGGLFGHNAF